MSELFLDFSAKILYNIFVGVFKKTRAYFVLAIVIAAGILAGCSSPLGAELTADGITLTVGERRSVAPYVCFRAGEQDRSVTLTCDSDCVQIDGSSLLAEKAGECVVTVNAAGKAFALSVTVRSRSPSRLNISADANAVQTATGDPLPVTFTAETDTDVMPLWNGEYSGASYIFYPDGYGEFTVTAAAGGLYAQQTVRVYKPTEVSVTVEGQTNQTGDYSEVRFCARERVDPANPRSTYVWSVNGETAGNSPCFSFVPESDGDYDISLSVNGVNRKIGDYPVCRVSAAGAKRAYVAFDDESETYIYCSEPTYISITDMYGKRKIFDVTDAQYSHLFENGRFKATEYIDLFGDGEYNIAIGGRIDRQIAFRQIPPLAERFVDNTVLCKNSYITSAAEGKTWVYELYSIGAMSAECYAADGSDAAEIEAAIGAACDELRLSARIAANGRVITASFDEYINSPYEYERTSVVTAHCVVPHIEYDGDLRKSDFVFYTDRNKKTVEVNNSEQLLLAALEGYKPLPAENTPSDTIYRAAKNVLLRIIGNSYGTEQKIHAIYDWLQYVTVKSSSEDGKRASGYLEGVFLSPRNSGSGYAVNSKGIAKAFALLCSLEGIECGIGYGGRWYNTVELDGVKYNVDVYGGKISGAEYGGGNAEMTSHRGLLIDDEALNKLGVTSDKNGEAFDAGKCWFFNKFVNNGIYTDYYIDGDDYASIEAAVFASFDSARPRGFVIPFVFSEVLFGGSYGAEFMVGNLSASEATAVRNSIAKAVGKYAELHESRYTQSSFLAAGNILGVVASPSA